MGVDFEWRRTRKAWFDEHNADDYECYICEKFLPRNETSLDHIKPRSSHPRLSGDLNNLQPACGTCQIAKGSKSLAYYLAERDKRGEYVSDYARELLKRQVEGSR
jgi:5-methylcytosine-specific restriction endonuclease McrA